MGILITGGLGFIGTALNKKLKATVFDKKDEETLGNFRKTYDTVIHLAASTYLTEGYDKDIIEDNIVLTSNVYRYHVDTRIVYASSAAIYNPNNLYSYSKVYGEDLFSTHPNATGLRYFNVYGENDNGIVSKLINAALTGSWITIYGGEQTRDFVFIDDVVRETIKAIDSDKDIIEVGTGVSTSINTLIEMVEEITKKPIHILREDRNEFEALNSRCGSPLKECTPLYKGLEQVICKMQQ